jgi:hypothetical protein
MAHLSSIDGKVREWVCGLLSVGLVYLASCIAFVRGLKLEHGTITVNWNRTDREARGSPLEPYFKADQDVQYRGR